MLGLLVLVMGFAFSDLRPIGFHPGELMAGGNSFLQAVVSNVLQTAPVESSITMKMAAFFAVIVLGKIVATSLTIGSGGSGGLLFPAVFLGGMTGAAYAKFCRALHDAGYLPAILALPPNTRAGLILVGMGGVFSACTKTPIASLVMISEITGSYGLLVPLMVTCASAYILSRSYCMNEEQVPGIADSPAHRGEFLINVLEGITVADALPVPSKPEVFHADTPFKTVLDKIKHSNASVFPIVDESDHLVGIFSLGDIRQIMDEQSVGMLVVAGDLGSTNVASVSLETNLDEALRLLTSKNVDELPVVESLNRPSRVLAMLSRRDLIAAYQRHLHKLEKEDELEHKGSDVFDEALGAASPDETRQSNDGLTVVDVIENTPLPRERDGKNS